MVSKLQAAALPDALMPCPDAAEMPFCGNRELLRGIAEKAPGSLGELARITGKAKSNLSRTLRTMEGYGLVRLERHGTDMARYGMILTLK
jgi:DNA-binding transcriptional ArsR family regulator